MNKNEALIYLISCSMNEIQPDEEIISDIDIAAVIKYAQSHSTGVAAAAALKNSKPFQEEKMDKESVKLIHSVIHSAMYRYILFDEERRKVVAFMEDHKIKYMPLKGILLKELYPTFGMREMADNDIFYDKKYQNELCSFFEKEGYTVSSVGKSIHDVYMKKPFFNFEMHTELFSKYFNEKVAEYYSELFTKLEKDDDSRYGYHFSKEDFYVYMIIHSYKHFKVKGTGIRSLMDIYIYNKTYREALDRAYIEHELSRFKMSGYEKKMRNLAYMVLENPDTCLSNIEIMSDKDKKILEYILGSGTYGNYKNKVDNDIRNYQKKQNNQSRNSLRMKAGYFLSKVFPKMEFYEHHYPLAYKIKIMIPFVMIGRIFRIILFDRQKLIVECKEIHRNFK